MPLARRASAGWERLCPGRVRGPAPPEVAWHIALDLWDHVPAPTGIRLACLAVLCVDCYMRPGAALGIQCADVLPPAPAAGASYNAWGLVLSPSTRRGRTKTGQQDDSLRVGVCGRAEAVHALELVWRSAARPGALFGTLTLPAFERHFRSAVTRLALGPLRLVPHCLRHTGPSHDVWSGRMDVAAVHSRGKWASPLSVKRYEKHAMLLRQIQRLSPAQQLEAARAAALLRERLRAELHRLFPSNHPASLTGTGSRARKRFRS